MTPQLKVGVLVTVGLVLLGGIVVATQMSHGKAAGQKLDEKSPAAVKPPVPANTNSVRSVTKQPERKPPAAAHIPANTNTNAGRSTVMTPGRPGSTGNNNSFSPLTQAPPRQSVSELLHHDNANGNANTHSEPARSVETAPPPSPPSGGESKPELKSGNAETSAPLGSEGGSPTLPPSPFAAERGSNSNMNGAASNANTPPHTLDRSNAPTNSGVATPPARSTPPPGSHDAATAPPHAPSAGAAADKYTIKSGDTLSKIAKERYGADKYWVKIREANPGLAPEKLVVGQMINLPAKDAIVTSAAKSDEAAKKPPAGSAAAPPRGAQLRREADDKSRTLTPPPPRPRTKPTSDADKAPASRAPSNVKPPVGSAGQPTQSPAAVEKAGATTAAPGAKTYVVEKGDTLKQIAQKTLKNGKRWREIYNANKDKIKDPNVLVIGTTLTIPNGAKAAAATKPDAKKKPGGAATKTPAATPH